MSAPVLKKVKIHYRLAKLIGDPKENFTLQQRLERAMKAPCGLDARERIIPIADEDQHKGCLNFSKIESSAFVADIMHLDGRVTLPRWIHPKTPRPVAEVVPREIAEGEASLGEPVYLLVRGNHVAVIERLSFRNSSLMRYLNGLLAKAGELEAETTWQLVPKIEMEGDGLHGGGVKRIIIKPNAAFGGDGPSKAPPEKAGKKGRRAASKLEDLLIHGSRIFEMLKAAGADEAKIETLRGSMSSDLVLKAKVELSVANVRKSTTATIAPDLIEKAFAELAAEGSVEIMSQDGRSDGKLVQLVHTAEVLETGGLIDWDRATQALVSAIGVWAAKGSIELQN